MSAISKVTATWLLTSTLFVSFASAQVLSSAPPLKEIPSLTHQAVPLLRAAAPLTVPEQVEPVAAPPPKETKQSRLQPEPSTPPTKTVRRHYRTGALESEQQVAKTPSGDDQPHGTYRAWDPQGRLIAQGQFAHGYADGRWERIYYGESAKKLLSDGQSGFQLPLVSEFRLHQGDVDGVWMISDAQDRRVRVWNFQRGLLHGETVVYFASGSRLRDSHYEQGVPVRVHREWDAEGSLKESHTFEHGRLLALETERWPDGSRRGYGKVLHPRYRLIADPDWWNGGVRIEASKPIGDATKVGEWNYFHPNGAVAQSGNYVRGEQEGAFSWWYPHGQLRASGTYRAGTPDGQWTWWHPGGEKQTSGTYAMGKETGTWNAWDTEGKLTKTTDYPGTRKTLQKDAEQEPGTHRPRGIRRERIDIPLTADRDSHRNLQVRPAETLRR